MERNTLQSLAQLALMLVITGAVTTGGLSICELLGANIDPDDYLLYGIYIPAGFIGLMCAMLLIVSAVYLIAKIIGHRNKKPQDNHHIRNDFNYGEWDHDWIHTAY